MDDDDLAGVFRDAAGPTPPAPFDHADVVRASDRIGARRRSLLTGGAAALVLLAGAGGIGGAVLAQQRDGSTMASSAGAGAPAGAPGDARAGGGAGVPAAGGAAPEGAAAPLGPGHTLCANRQDPALRALVEQVLPQVIGAPAAATTDECLPGAQRYVSVELGGGVLTVAYLPPGTEAGSAPGIGATGMSQARTASGGTVLVPDGYPQLLPYLAPRL